MVNKQSNQSIKHIQKETFDVFYSLRHQYPACVVESFNGFHDIGIDRNSVNEPFQPDSSVPKTASSTLDKYRQYMRYGGSYGHNAPAGFHKSSIAAYTDTFLLSNICPQEVVFNSGLWRVLEMWNKGLVKKYKTVTILTGSIDCSLSGNIKQYGSVHMYVPTHMYKITIVHNNNHHYIAAFLMPNKPSANTDLSNYLIHPSVLCDFIQASMNCDIEDSLRRASIVQKHNIIVDSVKTPKHWLTSIEAVVVPQTKQLQAAMASSKLYGNLVYAPSIEALNSAFQQGKDQNLINHYHDIYYKLAKHRLSEKTGTTT